MPVLLFLTIWVACGVLAYGITFAHFQRKFWEISRYYVGSDQGLAFLMACLGPLGLLMAFIMSDFACHGLLYRSEHEDAF